MTSQIRHVLQPNDYTCACACVAMLTGAPLDDVVAELRPTPKGGTRHAKIVAALRARGIACGDRFQRAIPDVGIVRITYPDKRVGHVVIKHGRQWHDPLLATPFTGDLPPNRAWAAGGRVTSALWVRL